MSMFFDKKSKFFVPKKKEKKIILPKRESKSINEYQAFGKKSEMFRSFLFFGR